MRWLSSPCPPPIRERNTRGEDVGCDGRLGPQRRGRCCHAWSRPCGGAPLHLRRAQHHGRVHARLPSLSASTLNVCLNDRTPWCNVPLPAWRCKLLGSQVLKKWLSYQERGVLEQPLRAEGRSMSPIPHGASGGFSH